MEEKSFNCFDLDQTIREIGVALGVSPAQIQSAVQLLDEGNTIPFIARYRKEATRGLDEVALRQIEDALAKARELAQRKTTILKTIHEQGQLTPELQAQIQTCTDRQVLESLYLPFKPERRTKATAARERGLQPLADLLLRQERLNRPKSTVLKPYVNAEKGVETEEAALQGACDILAEQWSQHPPLRQWLLEQAGGYGVIASTVKRGKQAEASKFEMYFDHREPVKRVPSHRLLAMNRGEAEGLLKVSLKLDDEFVLANIKPELAHNPQFEFYRELQTAVEDCYQRLLLPAVESAVFEDLKNRADQEAIAVFASNLRELLLAAPAGPQMTIGVDPGFRTGCKLAVVDGTGKFLSHTTIYPTPPKSDLEGAAQTLKALITKYDAKLIAIGNGTASRETEAFVADVIKRNGLQVTQVKVSESGASIYSASELAAREYPDLDLTIRGAISIAHRLQDPLAELVKIDPKSIGVGQYQHDVNQSLLRKSLDREVESCVNLVGVDVNLASAPLLAHVAGIGPKLAEKIVEYRDANGRFKSREELENVPKLGRKAFEQAAGFLRIRDGQQPLDNSAVHPESYYVVKRMAAKLNVSTKELVGNGTLATRLQAADFVDEKFGLPTVQDILAELAKPGRDPRSEFKVAQFAEGINELSDLKVGMVLEGVITNVTKFGAFVDIGVHQDGLIHVSQLANKFIQDPSEVVAVGDVVRVKVLEVDLDRKRIAVSRKQAM
ncbi:Tex family protein [Anatilimnocola floriformis]|uniref:Tex family protein n=1 Tax=Anatilimnocola floriformis TaxID=2948575 RepID=UPI0020C427D6|nr:Tex family protein [Anatilimnocola floriformis]